MRVSAIEGINDTEEGDIEAEIGVEMGEGDEDEAKWLGREMGDENDAEKEEEVEEEEEGGGI